MKKWFNRIVTLLLCFSLSILPFIQSAHAQTDDITGMSYEELLKAADGQSVTFYGWGGDEKLNHWLDEVYGPALKEKYNITLERVPMPIEDILTQLTSEKQANATESTIDMIWINGENFRTARENDFLYGPFVEQLPNYAAYINPDDIENQSDFGYPIEGYEAPYGKAQLVMIKDSAVTAETPKNAAELLDFVKKYPGKVTYPALPDFTGSAFVRNLIYEFVDYKTFQDMPADKATVKAAIQPALDYLVSLNPYLWNEGKSFPSDSTTLENMFMDGEVVLYQTYGAYSIAKSIADGKYPETSESFIFDKGSIGNTNFIAIAKNSTHKAAAIVAINEMLSPAMQLSRYEQLKTIPVVDNNQLAAEDQAAFAAVELGKGTIPQAELLAKRLPEMPSALVPIIEEIWLEEVVGK